MPSNDRVERPLAGDGKALCAHNGFGAHSAPAAHHGRSNAWLEVE